MFNSLAFCVAATVSLQACALSDWLSYNFSRPPKVTIIPQEQLRLQWKRLDPHTKNAAPYVSVLGDKKWGLAFEDIASSMYGWRPDFCHLYETRRVAPIYVERDMEPDIGADRLKKALWNSYLRNVYYDTMETTPTVTSNPTLLYTISLIVALQDSLLSEFTRAKGDALGINEFFSMFLAAQTNPPVPESNLPKTVEDIKDTVPSCPNRPNAAAPNDNEEDSLVSHSFLERLLVMIDKDHSEFLVDLNPVNNIRAALLAKRIVKWRAEHDTCCSVLTVSKKTPSSLSPSVKRIEPDPTIAKSEPSTAKKEEGEVKELTDLMKSLLLKSSCKAGLISDECNKTKETESSRSKTIDSKGATAAAMEEFVEQQKMELTLSSVLNSPDSANRLEYATSYIYFYPYPYPSNNNITLGCCRFGGHPLTVIPLSFRTPWD